MADAEVDAGRPTALPAPGEDLIESEAASSATTEIRRRLERVVPPMVSRKVVGGIAAAALVLGLVIGFLVDTFFGTEKEAALQAQESAGPPGGYIPIVPDGSPLEEDGVVVLSLSSALLTRQDLAGLGETALPGSYGSAESAESDQLCGLSGSPETVPFPPGAGVEYTVFDSVSFVLAGASLTERIGPDLDVLSASTLRARIELARNCSSTGLTVSTEGVQAGIGDEYAVFTVERTDPASSSMQSSILVLVRVGDQLVELTLSAVGGPGLPDGLTRALRIAEVAVVRMLIG
ncbi:MAG: hypothetical protein H0X18_19720 [Geodermatophilaceae bacterium]|nr:hypothetical protein [Geodermatophilaceae bacterium]